MAVLLLVCHAVAGFGSTYYVATNGVDTNAGTSNSPFATITKAQSAAGSGDIVYLRGGTYFLNNMNLTATNGTSPNSYQIVNNLAKSGISYVAYPGERPVFDFSNVQPVTNRVTAFLVTASDCVFKGFEVVGVQVTIHSGQANNTQSECFRVAGGNRNRFEQLAMHDGMGIGWYLTSGQSNLVLCRIQFPGTSRGFVSRSGTGPTAFTRTITRAVWTGSTTRLTAMAGTITCFATSTRKARRTTFQVSITF